MSRLICDYSDNLLGKCTPHTLKKIKSQLFLSTKINRSWKQYILKVSILTMFNSIPSVDHSWGFPLLPCIFIYSSNFQLYKLLAFQQQLSTSKQKHASQKIVWSWSKRLFVVAALCLPVHVGWSGTTLRNLSSSDLNLSTLIPLRVLIQTGSRLKILAPFTPSEASLACLTAELASLWTG